MKNPALTRRVAGLGVTAAAITATALTLSPASAAIDSQTITSENMRVVLSVSDSTPRVGDTITVSADFQRSWSLEIVNNVKFVVPNCLNYVDGSMTMQNKAVTNVENNTGPTATGQAYVRGNGPWTVSGGFAESYGSVSKLTAQLTVSPSCATGQAQQFDIHWGSAISGTSASGKGPFMTVAKATDPGDGGGNNGGGNNGSSGSLDTGSLGGLFG